MQPLQCDAALVRRVPLHANTRSVAYRGVSCVQHVPRRKHNLWQKHHQAQLKPRGPDGPDAHRVPEQALTVNTARGGQTLTLG